MPIATASLNQKIFVRPSEIDQYGPEEGWQPIRKPRVITSMDGRHVTIQGQKARYLPLLSCERILKIALALLCTIASLGLALASKTIRRCFSGYQEVKVVQEFSHFRRPPPSRPSKSNERKSGTEEDLRSSCPLSGAAAERLRVFSETETKAAPNLWQHYTQALTQYSRSSPDVQSEILAVYIRDYTFESNKGVSLEEFRVRFGPPPPMRNKDDIHKWDNITQYALQILRERQGPLSPGLRKTLFSQLRAFFKAYPEQCLATYPESERTESQRDALIAKRDRAIPPLEGHPNSLLVKDGNNLVSASFSIADPDYRERFLPCTGIEFITRIWLFTQTYFDFKNPGRGTQDAQNAIITALSGAYDNSGGISCHQGKCSHIAAIVLHSRLDGMGDGDFKRPEGEVAKDAAEEFFGDPDQGAKHRAILDKEVSFSRAIQEELRIEARNWYKSQGLTVNQRAFEEEVLQYARNYYI